VLTASDIAPSFDHARELGEGRWVSQCPVHKGGQNLYITDGRKGTLIFCQAGCDTADVLDQIDLSMRDLYLDRAPIKFYDPENDATAMQIYQAAVRRGEKLGDTDAIFINTASRRLRKNGYCVDQKGNLNRVTA
jgi:hypothetical protein|tara:strand:- start:499 stop:900 length:402 start_codon:yes stop_codon:yes gene_type:complete